MITAIREVRRARGLTLDEVARACVPATTAQTISRLETGTRTVSVAWINRLADALGVSSAELLTLPTRADLPVAAVLGADGARAPRQSAGVAVPAASAGAIAVTVAADIGDYRNGDELWCVPLAPDDFTAALNRDVLVPQTAGRFVFGRLVGCDPGAVRVIPPDAGATERTISDPAWIARVVRLVRSL